MDVDNNQPTPFCRMTTTRCPPCFFNAMEECEQTGELKGLEKLDWVVATVQARCPHKTGGSRCSREYCRCQFPQTLQPPPPQPLKWDTISAVDEIVKMILDFVCSWNSRLVNTTFHRHATANAQRKVTISDWTDLALLDCDPPHTIFTPPTNTNNPLVSSLVVGTALPEPIPSYRHDYDEETELLKKKRRQQVPTLRQKLVQLKQPPTSIGSVILKDRQVSLPPTNLRPPRLVIEYLPKKHLDQLGHKSTHLFDNLESFSLYTSNMAAAADLPLTLYAMIRPSVSRLLSLTLVVPRNILPSLNLRHHQSLRSLNITCYGQTHEGWENRRLLVSPILQTFKLFIQRNSGTWLCSSGAIIPDPGSGLYNGTLTTMTITGPGIRMFTVTPPPRLTWWSPETYNLQDEADVDLQSSRPWTTFNNSGDLQASVF